MGCWGPPPPQHKARVQALHLPLGVTAWAVYCRACPPTGRFNGAISVRVLWRRAVEDAIHHFRVNNQQVPEYARAGR